MKFLKNEIKFVIIQSIIVVILSLLLEYLTIISNSNNFSVELNIEYWLLNNGIITIIFPIICVIPTCYIIFYEKKNHMIAYMMSRMNIKKYILKRWLFTAVMGALIIFLIYFVTMNIAYFYTQVDDTEIDEEYLKMLYIFPDLLKSNTYVYGMLLCVWRGIIGFFITTMGFILALCCKNFFVVLITPFIYGLLNSFALQVFAPGYDFYSCVDSGIGLGELTVEQYLVGLLIIVLSDIFLLIYYKLIKRVKIVEL